MKKMVLVVVLVTLVLGAYGQERSSSGEDYRLSEEDYGVWSRWETEQKVWYVWGMMSGAQVMAAKFSHEYSDLTEAVKSMLPPYAVRDYVATVDFVYEVRELRDVPFWAIIFNADYWLEERISYE